ncbi:MAG: DNA polymerase III subunit gamma/tau [Bacteroidales bacterium]|nr:DNA polymerase III subunit gamma/tau [Bacteroidales bacterium]
MEQYIVSARKYRPTTFASVVGQKALTSTLKNAIASERLAHSYLFCGSRGVGKTSCARIFAKTINCLNRSADGEACNCCDSCRAFNEGNSMNIVELDAASHNGIDDMRALIEQVQVPPTNARYRVFIIDEVHMLSAAAFNAFLKTLEEPPSYVVFILATTEKHKIIPTILSRCQIYDFNRITVSDMVSHLQYVASHEGIEAEPAALNIIARQADGAMRDALSIFDQVAASSRGKITYDSTIANLNVLDSGYYSRLVDAFVAGDVPAALLVFHEVRRNGFDPQVFINGLGEYIRDLMLAKSPATVALLDAPDDVKVELEATAAKVSADFLYEAIGLCNDADLNYRQASNKQLLIELTLIRIAQLLSPSPVKRGRGEGPIRPIAKPAARQATSAPATTDQPDQKPQPARAQPPRAAATPAQGSAATVPPPAPPSRPGAPTMRVGTLSMSGRAKVTAAAHPAVQQARDEAYDDSNVAAAWVAYINDHPKEHLLINSMRENMPSRLSGHRHAVSVENDVEGKLLRDVLDNLTRYIRDKIANDSFTLEVVVENNGPSPAFWNDREVLEHMRGEYPVLEQIIRDLKLTLL